MAYKIRMSYEFERWLTEIRNDQAKARLLARLKRVQRGLIGDTRALSGGLHELREHFGAGWRMYYVWRPPNTVIMLTGGLKGSQAKDILRARRIAAGLEE